MKKNNNSLIILLAVGLLGGACKKELNVFPTTAEVDGNLITDQAGAQVVLNGVYYRFANAGKDYNAVPTTYWTNVNENIGSELSGLLTYGIDPNPFDNVSLTPADGYSELIWKYGYALVNAANGFIKNATTANIPATTKQQMLAEAQFLRAFGNSELLLYYGQYNDPASEYGIVLRDEFVTDKNIALPRSNVAAAYTSILTDLDAAIKGLPVTNSAVYYANVSVAKLLKARVLMNRGASGDYAQVIGLANDIITNGPFALEDSLKDIFLTKGFKSREVILGIQPYPNEDYKYTSYQAYSNYLVSDSLVSLLADDSRNQWVYKYAFTNSYLNAFVNLLTKYYSGDPTHIAQTPLSTYCYAFRLTEAYLLKAEAITLSTGDLASAKALLKTVMSHAGAGATEMAAVANAATPQDLQLEIVKENMRNFSFENGLDWFALRRLPLATIKRLNPKIKNITQLIFPIPVSELADNNVIQNPGY